MKSLEKREQKMHMKNRISKIAKHEKIEKIKNRLNLIQ